MTLDAAPDALIARRADDFAARPVPVLRATVSSLARMARRQESVKPREVAIAVLRDPMLTLTVLRHLRTHHSRRMLEDITTVEHAVMMLGVSRFFSTFGKLPVVEEVLGADPRALAGLMQVVCRARGAAIYAGTLAALRADVAPEQVAVAALLHDLVEMLLWCFDPERAAAIAGSLAAQPGLRSATAQQQALGFTLIELQLRLARRWDLPELILSLMDDAQAEKPRVRNVALSVALARHAAHGWRNPALPADVEGIARLLGSTRAETEARVFDATLRFIAERMSYCAGLSHAPLPPLPRPAPPPEGAAPEEQPAGAFELARAWLTGLTRGQPLPGHPRGGLVRDAQHQQLAAVAALMDGITDGLGFAGGLFLAPEAGGARWQVLFVAGEAGAQSLSYLRADPEAMASVAEALAARSAVARAGTAPATRTCGLFAWPAVYGGEPCAIALALDPVASTSMAPESFHRFQELGAGFDAALRSVDASPFWKGAVGIL